MGLFFDEPAGHLQFFADAFIKLLRMTVLPYIVVSLVASPNAVKVGKGVIEKVDAGARTVTVKTEEGATDVVHLSEDTTVKVGDKLTDLGGWAKQHGEKSGTSIFHFVEKNGKKITHAIEQPASSPSH